MYHFFIPNAFFVSLFPKKLHDNNKHSPIYDEQQTIRQNSNDWKLEGIRVDYSNE
jgi:hypothetical protein